MALYAIGDFHLSFFKNKPMDIFGDVWHNHPQKIIDGFHSLTENDVSVICGDLSWGMNLDECKDDFAFVDSLPGKKIILKGNHDYWWSTASKAYKFFEENGFHTIDILNNNCYFYGDYAICGTRGWFYEEESGTPHDAKVMKREILRLESSLKAAGNHKILVFLHYPPVYRNYICNEIVDLFIQYHVELCCYGHLHGKSCYGAFNGIKNETRYQLVSGDFINFCPYKVL